MQVRQLQLNRTSRNDGGEIVALEAFGGVELVGRAGRARSLRSLRGRADRQGQEQRQGGGRDRATAVYSRSHDCHSPSVCRRAHLAADVVGDARP
jgi:hypothetical protein